MTTGRNVPCPCGSGKKYKHCCGAAKPQLPVLDGLMPGVRMKGGVRNNPEGSGFIPIIHVWGNIDCRGEPSEWRSPRVFSTEDAAMHYYKTAIRPALEKSMAKLAKEQPGVKFSQKKLE